MCLYTPQGTKKRVHGSSSGAKSSTRSTSARDKHRQPMPRNIVVNQPAPIVQPLALPQYQQPRIEIEGTGETTNIWLPSPALTQNGQFQGQGQSGGQQGGNQGNGQHGGQQNQNGSQGQERRRSSMIITEVEGVMRLARRVSDAVRRGSASSFGRGRDYYREEARRERSRERRSHRASGTRRRHRRSSSSRSTSRSRSRERTTRDKRLMGTVDEEARQMARYAGGMAEGLLREREVRREAERLVEEKRGEEERLEERLADRVLSRYGSGGLLGPPPPPRGLLRGGSDWRDGRDWREGVSWAPWNAAAVGMNYGVAPPMPPPAQQPTQTNGSGTGSNLNGDGGRGERSGRSEGLGASNHIHVHTAPLVQGPHISTTTPGSSGGYAEMPGMVAGANSAEQRRSSWVEPFRHVQGQVQRAIEQSMGGMRGYGMGGGMGIGMGIPGLQTHFSGGAAPMHTVNAVPIGEREWQRARVYGSHAPDNGLGGMMY